MIDIAPIVWNVLPQNSIRGGKWVEDNKIHKSVASNIHGWNMIYLDTDINAHKKEKTVKTVNWEGEKRNICHI